MAIVSTKNHPRLPHLDPRALWALAWRGLWRELKNGALTTMLLALIVAVASVTAVGFFTDRVDAGMRAQAAEFLAADGRITSPDSLAKPLAQAQTLGLATAQTLQFPTVILAGDHTQLVSLKAVSAGYPLRGSLTIAPSPQALPHAVTQGPAEGTVWLAPRALALLNLAVGDAVQIGQKTFTISAVLLREPDVGNFFAQAAPRAMINLGDIPATGLVTPASRVEHALLLAAPAAERSGLLSALSKKLPADLSIERPENSQPAFKTAFDRAARFLGLAAMVAVLLAGAALLIAAQHYNRVQQDPAALMRAFGAQSATIFKLYTLRLTLLAVLAAIPGIAIGALTQLGLSALLGSLLNFQLPPPSWAPVGFGVGIALVALLGFALPALLRLKDTPPLRVLNNQLAAPPPAAALLFGAGLAAMAVLVWLQARDAALTGYVLGGLGLSLAGFIGVIWLLLQLLRRYPARGIARFGLARLARAPWASATQIAALALGLTAILLLGVVRGDLLGAWQAQIPADAPNFFAINIQPDEVAPIEALFNAQQIHGAGFYAMNRARLAKVNGQPIDTKTLHGQAKNLSEREFNLSTQPEKLGRDNTLIEGQWQPTQTGWSVEQGIAKTLHWRLGDKLTFTVNGAPVTAAITSIRKVNWDSMRPNFFVLGSADLLANSPAQFVTSFYLPEPNLAQQKALLQQFPTLTLFDLSQILGEVRTLIKRASQAVQYVFMFTLLAGMVVLLAAFHASEADRLRETAILRVLGASHRQVRHSLWIEFIVLGVLTGLLAALAAGGLGALLAVKLFNLPWQFDARLWLYGLGAGLILAALLVPLLSRRVLASPPAAALRGG
ncbi:MAG: FtsX-like permease family protein [Halothiobacillaceae bacterium]|nr:FtsX-like permease family protein [Halothiobacillaceae bacterium]